MWKRKEEDTIHGARQKAKDVYFMTKEVKELLEADIIILCGRVEFITDLINSEI